jgi:hypothetical protein
MITDIIGEPVEIDDIVMYIKDDGKPVFKITESYLDNMMEYHEEWREDAYLVLKKADGRKILNADFIIDEYGGIEVRAYGNLDNSPEDNIEECRRLT